MLEMVPKTGLENLEAALDYYINRELDLLQRVDQLQLENTYLRHQLELADTGTFARVSEG